MSNGPPQWQCVIELKVFPSAVRQRRCRWRSRGTARGWHCTHGNIDLVDSMVAVVGAGDAGARNFGLLVLAIDVVRVSCLRVTEGQVDIGCKNNLKRAEAQEKKRV